MCLVTPMCPSSPASWAYKTSLLTGKRIGKFGRKAKHCLASKVHWPWIMDDWAWKKSKAQWEKLDDEGKQKFEEELMALGCIEVDLDKDDEAIARRRATLNCN